MILILRYLNAACYTASSWTSEDSSDNQIEEYKGCSAFKLDEDEHYCNDFEISSIPYKSCKSTCSEEGCNSKSEQKTISCHVCYNTLDSNNNTIGSGDPSCSSQYPSAWSLQSCAEGENYCIVEIEVDWFLYGEQTTAFRRSCSSKVNKIFSKFNVSFCC